MRRFNQRTVVGISVLTFCVCSAVAAPDAGAQEPRVNFAERAFDFGTVNEGSVVEHPFQLENKGDAPLKIVKLHPDCGCTAVSADNDVIEPGASTAIKVSFNTGGFQGEKVKTIRVYTNDPQESTVLLTIRGQVKPDVTVEPEVIDFGKVRAGEDHHAAALVYVVDQSPTKFLDARSHTVDLEVSAEDFSETGRSGKKLAITLKSSAPEGVFRGRIALRTTSTRNPIVDLAVLARLEGDLVLEPPSVVFGSLAGPLPDPVIQTAKLRNSGERPMHIVSIESDNPAVTAEFNPVENSKDYAIEVILAKSATSIVRAHLKIVTDQRDKGEAEKNLVLPVYAIVTGGTDS